jgi:hypothetical protein
MFFVVVENCFLESGVDEILGTPGLSLKSYYRNINKLSSLGSSFSLSCSRLR